jgi:hypothetical protein
VTDPAEPPTGDAPPAERPTVGTGSALGIGCVVAVLLLVLIAIALRAFTNVW